MQKAGIDTEGPKTFLQIGEQYSSTSESELDSSAEKANTNFESQLEAELGNGASSEAIEEDHSEKDQLTDDDDEVIEVKKPEPNLNKVQKLKSKPKIVFAELSSTGKNTAKAKAKNHGNEIPIVKQDTEILYNKPAKTFPDQMKDKIKILRENSMRQLQKTHVWSPAKSERNNEAFNKIKFQQGNKDADLFVSFLGYIRDTTYKQSPPLFEKIKSKFSK